MTSNVLTRQSESGINLDSCELPPFPGTHHNQVLKNVACGTPAIGGITFGGSTNNNVLTDNVATSISLFGTGNNLQNNTTRMFLAPSAGNFISGHLFDNAVCL